MIQFCAPDNRSLALSDALPHFTRGITQLPFNAPALSLVENLSTHLLESAGLRQFPELTALGFALRKNEIERLRSQFDELQGTGRLLQPRGLIFQIAAGNVDTLFVYAWIFALLTGNRSIVRLSSKLSPQIDVLLSCLGPLLDESPELQQSNHFIRYGHDSEITAALSQICDLRTIWGGDQSVESIRSISLPVFARDLPFPDRYSMAAISSASYVNCDEATKRRLTQNFYTDAFWFDQAACSSPRLVVFCGAPENNARASADFFEALNRELKRRNYSADPSLHMTRFLFSCQSAIDRPLAKCRRYGQMTVLELPSLESLSRDHCGGGLFFEAGLADLSELAPHITRRDQTLVQFGFAPWEIQELAAALNGRGLDRIVPMGQALTFGRFWDGFDLLAEFTRSVALA